MKYVHVCIVATLTVFIITSAINRLYFFPRFGLSNRFDTEFPSVLTGKVLSFYYDFFPPLALQSRGLSVHFQVGRIKQ